MQTIFILLVIQYFVGWKTPNLHNENLSAIALAPRPIMIHIFMLLR